MTKPIQNKNHDRYVKEFLTSIDVDIRINNRDKIFARIYEIFCASDRTYNYYMVLDSLRTVDVGGKRYYIERLSKEKKEYLLLGSRSRQNMERLAEKLGQPEIPPRRVKKAVCVSQ